MSTTAWGETLLYYATPLTGGILGTTWVQVGTIKEDTLSLETADGTKLELWGSGHVLVDSLLNEGTMNIKATVIGISSAIKSLFWDMNGAKVESLVNSSHYSFKIATKVTGSDTFLAPWCSVNMKPLFSEKEGWTAELNIAVLKGDAGYFFETGTV